MDTIQKQLHINYFWQAMLISVNGKAEQLLELAAEPAVKNPMAERLVWNFGRLLRIIGED